MIKFNKISTQKRLVVMVFVAIVTLVTLWSYGVILQEQTRKLNATWLEFTTIENQQVTALATISKGFGYGGFIHNFKNYVLRHSEKYYLNSQRNLSMTYEGIEKYLSLLALHVKDIDPHHPMLLFKSTVDIYKTKLELAHQLILEGKPPRTIDNQVYVDDTLALNALEKLFSDLSQFSESAKVHAEMTMNESRNLSYYGMIIIALVVSLVFYIVFKLTLEISNSYKQIRLLLDAAPNGIIRANHAGQIVTFNQHASEMFGYSSDEFSQLNIEDLIPPEYRTGHKEKREQFLAVPNNVMKMGTRKIEFKGIKRTGQIFPISLSLASYDDGKEIGSISILKDITDERKLEDKANKDHLTRLANRHSAEQFLSSQIKRIQRHNDAVSVIILDIDFFKHINDTFGHQTGDHVLKRVSNIMQQNVRDSDLVARWGGEEFLIICPSTAKDIAKDVAEKIRRLIEHEFAATDTPITVSAGVAEFIQHTDTEFTVIHRADEALYRSKSLGRNQTSVS
jgi:diguanylate cyclase (GGDEF)-like protein/PAS domain S-box-containing protein